MTAEEHFQIVDETSFPKYTVGHTVCSKFTGFPGVATIVGVLPAISYCNMINVYNFDLWDELFPNWRMEPIYIVMFEEMRKTVRFEEFLRRFNDEQKSWYKEGALEQIYERTVTHSRCISYPEQDLELFQ